MKRNYILLATLAVSLWITGCSDDFLNEPPQDRLVDANFYKSDQQVLSATAPLYSAAWKTYVDKANFKLGDIRGGTVFRAWGDRDAVEFNITDVSEANEQAYQAFYVVIGQANLTINNINKFGGPKVSAEIKNHAIAEARFMRATAYTHLVMNYGAVPIIENNLEYLSSPGLKRNTIESVWEFIKRDYEFAAENLSTDPVEVGRVTKWSAEGMLARTHLTMAGLGKTAGSRDQAHLDKAKEYAERVITMSGKSLLPNYEDLFRYPYDNNNESLFELQWVFTTSPNGYEASNTMGSQITYSNDIAANGDGWGGDLSATWWLLSKYDGLMKDQGATPGFTLDERLKATFMLPGFRYPEVRMAVTNPDGTPGQQPLVFPSPGATADNSYASIKKYVVGKVFGADGQPQSDRQRYPNNTYMLRLAEMYLIYAEAELGNGAILSNGKGMDYYNAVRTRAGLAPHDPVLDGPVDWETIYEERAKEFAMESMLWYDLVRLHYYNPDRAYSLIREQDRGLFVVKPNRWPDPTAWSFTKTSWFANRTANPTPGNFILPLPASEVSNAPSLGEEPVPYEFKD
jgi:starch-binding outer membrane protein, SusD/RagB family